MSKRVNIRLPNINESIISEYENNDSIWNEDSLELRRIKYILENYLTPNERLLFILYLECNNRFKEFTKLTNSELSVARSYIMRLKLKIRNIYNELFNND
jgi:hypothetical protein